MAIQKNQIVSRTPVYYSLEDGKGLLEESLNFTYCRPDTVYLEYDFYLDTIYIPVVTTYDLSGTAKWITNEKLEEAFIEISSRAGGCFGNLSGSDKQPVLFGAKLKDYGGLFSSDTIEIHYYLISGIGIDQKAAPAVYGEDDHWFWDDVGGKCSPYSGEYGLGAASIFQRDLRRDLIPSRIVNRDFYFKNHEIFCFHVSDCSGYHFPENLPVDSHFGGLEQYIFYNQNPCLDDDKMNEFYSKYRNDLILSFAPTGKYTSTVYVGYTLLASYVHVLACVYSEREQFVAVPSFPLPLSPE